MRPVTSDTDFRNLPTPALALPRRLWYTVGLPGSGKSTWARRAIEAAAGQNLTLHYVSKDELRAANPTFSERRIHAVQTETLQKLLVRGQGPAILVDNTHLNPRTVGELETLAARYGYLAQPVSFLDTALEECVQRDRQRQEAGERFVERSIIKLMAMKYGLVPPPPRDERPSAVLIDLDGTLANNSRRLHFISERPKDWTGWYKAIPTDTVIPHVRDIYQMLVDAQTLRPETAHRIIFLSGRAEALGRVLTEAWLEANGFTHYDLLIMRRQPNDITDDIVKETLYGSFVEPFYEVKWVMDDRQRVVDMWRTRLGLPVFQAAPGDF